MKLIFGFSKPKNKFFPWFSYLIRLFQDTSYSHCYLKIPLDGIDEIMTFQASGLQVNMVGNEYFNSHEQPVYEYQLILDLSELNRKKLLEFIFANLGKSYGVLEVFKICWAKITKNKSISVENINQTTWVCSEIMACILEDILDINMKIDFTTAEPKDIQLFLDTCPLFTRTLPIITN